MGLLAALRALLRRLSGRAPPAPPPAGFRSKRGFELRSRGEVLIANWLDDHGFAWEYEARVAGFTPDFMLRKERILIEYWGMRGASKRYDAKIADKRARYKQEGWTLINVERRHLMRLDEKLARKLLPRR